MRVSLVLAAAFAMTGCHQTPPERQGLDALDDQLISNAGNLADPAMTAALHDPIMVDPALAQTASGGQPSPPAAKAAPSPMAGNDTPPAPAPKVPPQPVARALAERRPPAAMARCASSLTRGDGWVRRLPADVALYPGAAVTEAAGSDTGGCALRVLSFTTRIEMAEVAAWYRGHSAGFVVTDRRSGSGRTVTGDAPDRAFVLYLAARSGGGTSADLIATSGR